MILDLRHELFDDYRVDILLWIGKEIELRTKRKDKKINEYLKKIIKQEINLELLVNEIPADSYRSYYTFTKNKKVYTIYLALFSDNYYVKLNHYHSKL